VQRILGRTATLYLPFIRLTAFGPSLRGPPLGLAAGGSRTESYAHRLTPGKVGSFGIYPMELFLSQPALVVRTDPLPGTDFQRTIS